MYLPLSPEFDYPSESTCSKIYNHLRDILLVIYSLVVFTLAVGLLRASHQLRVLVAPHWTLWYIAAIQTTLIFHIFGIIYLVKFRNV